MRQYLPTPEGLRDNLWSQLIWLLLVGLLGAAALAAKRLHLNPLVWWSCLTAAGLVLWTLLIAFVFRRWNLNRFDSAEGTERRGLTPTTFAPRQDQAHPADPGAIERFNELYPYCLDAVQAVLLQLQRTMTALHSLRTKSRDERPDLRWISLLTDLVSTEVERPCEERAKWIKSLMDHTSGGRVYFGAPNSLEDLQKRAYELSHLLCDHYTSAWKWLLRLGMVLYGKDEFLSTDDYRRCYGRHEEMIRELKKVRARTDIGIVARCLAVLEEQVTPPTARGS